MKKRLISFALAFVMLLSLMPQIPIEAEAADNGIDLLTCAPFISNTSHRTYIDKMMKQYLRSNSTLINALDNGKTVTMMFEGGSDNYPSYGYSTSGSNVRNQALAIVLKKVNGTVQIVFYCEDCSTIPSQPADSTNNATTLLDGVYSVFTLNHRGQYAALQISAAKGYYISSSTANGSLGGASGINIHTRSTDTAGSPGYAWSTGCLLIGSGDNKNNPFNAYMKAAAGISFNPWLSYSNKSFGEFSEQEKGKTVGYCVIDRQLARDGLRALYSEYALSQITAASSTYHEHSYGGCGICLECDFVYDWESTLNRSAMGNYTVLESFTPSVDAPYSAATSATVCMTPGTAVKVLGSYKNAYYDDHNTVWYKFEYGDGEIGYAYGGYLQFESYFDLEATCSGFFPSNNSVLEKKAQNVTGIVTSSNYPLKQIDAYLDGLYYASWNASNTSTMSVDIKNTNINYKLDFASLAEGEHWLTLRAIDYVHSGSVKFCSSLFYIESGNTYNTLTFNPNGDSSVPEDIVAANGTTVTIPDMIPTTFGKFFCGWSTSLDSTVEYAPGDEVTLSGNMTLYALWDCYEYTYTNPLVYNSEVKYPGAEIWVSLSVPESSYYQFEGINNYALDTVFELYDANGSLLAADDDGAGNLQFRQEVYLQAGQEYHICISTYGQSADGYIGYYKYHIAKRAFAVFYSDIGASDIFAYQSADDSSVYYATLNNYTPEKDGYTFIGWSTDPNATTAMYQPGERIAISVSGQPTAVYLYPVWEELTSRFVFYYNDGNGTVFQDITAAEQTTVYVPADVPARIGYNFVGWSSSPSATSASLMPGDEITARGTVVTYYAVWRAATSLNQLATANVRYGYEKIWYTFTPEKSTSCQFLDLDIDNVGIDSVVEVYDSAGNLVASDDDSGEGRVFDLRCQLNAGETYYVSVRVFGGGTGEICIAVSEGHYVEYDANGGTGAPENEYWYSGIQGVWRPFDETVPTREGYMFLGWATTSDATTAEYVPGDTCAIRDDITFYAVWGTIGGTCGDNLTWELDDSGTLTISGTGAMTDFEVGSVYAPWYDYNSSINNVVIADSVTTIGKYAFYNCDNLISVTIGNGVTFIGENAFCACTRLTSLNIPGSVTNIDPFVFQSCPSLTGIWVDSSNANYSNDAYGVLYNKNKTELISFVGGFSGSYTIPDSVKTIAMGAFAKCDSLTTLEIPDSVTTIERAAFFSCDSLTDVYYIGTQEQWDSIDVGSDNGSLQGAAIHITVPTLTGITVKTQPTKTEYWLGESLDTTGLTLTATYSDGSTETVTNGYTVSGFDSTTAGTKTVTVTYSGKSTTFTVTVNEPVITGIAIHTLPDKTEFWTGDSFEVRGLSLLVTYSDGSTEVVTTGMSVEAPDTFSAGMHSVVVEYQGFETTYEVLVIDPVIDYIYIAREPVKTEYWIGESFDTTNLLVRAHLTNGDSRTISENYSLTGFDSTVAGTKTITVNYDGHTATFTVQVNTPVMTGILVTPVKTEYWAGEDFDFSECIVTATYSDGNQQMLDSYYTDIVDNCYLMLIGTHTVKVWVDEGFSANYTITVKMPYVVSIAIAHLPDKTEYWIGEKLNRTGMILAVTYNYGATHNVAGTPGAISGFDSESAGTKTVTVTYEGCTATFDVIVKEPAITVLSVMPNKTEYWIGEELLDTDVAVNATYENGATATITTGYTVSGFDSTTAGSKTVTVTYGNKTATFTVTVNEAVVEENAPKYEILGAMGTAGSEVEVYIVITNNPGIISLRNKISYDTEALELVKVEDLGLLNGYTIPSATIASPYTLRWADSLANENNIANGELVKLTFRIKEDAQEGAYTVSIEPIEARDINGTKITFAEASAKITVMDYIVGDTDGDGEITDWDAITLNRYLAGWSVEVGLGADADSDGEITDWDAILLERYLAGWDVQLGE